jgi:hypothetical protein
VKGVLAAGGLSGNFAPFRLPACQAIDQTMLREWSDTEPEPKRPRSWSVYAAILIAVVIIAHLWI